MKHAEEREEARVQVDVSCLECEVGCDGGLGEPGGRSGRGALVQWKAHKLHSEVHGERAGTHGITLSTLGTVGLCC